MFMGEFNHTIDNKGRIIVPSRVREDLGDKFIVAKGYDRYLSIYPREAWERVIAKFKNFPDTKDHRSFMRLLMSGATECELDGHGRVNIPSSLVEYAYLEKDCVIIGVDERLEVWSKVRWEEFISQNEENFSDIAENLFTTSFNN